MASNNPTADNVGMIINRSRISLSLTSVLSLLAYCPFGVLLLLFRLFMIPQALFLLLIIPKGLVKRYLLWIFTSVLGLVVMNKEFGRRSPSTRMFIANWISYVDYISLHISMECSTSSVNGWRPFISRLFRHYTFSLADSNIIAKEVKKVPEFDDSISLPDTIAVPFISQPEHQPTNGDGLLNFDLWPFTVDKSVQPLALSSWRPLNVNLTTIDSSELSDFLWTLFCPITIIYIQVLPVVESRDDSIEEFAKKTQKRISAALGVSHTNCTQDAIKEWRNRSEQSSSNVVRKSNTATGPIIPESDFNKVKVTSEIEKMVQHVLAVFPDAPQHLIRRDLLETRSIDVTLTKFLDGRIAAAPVPPSKPSKASYSLQDCHDVYLMKKQQLIEEARRRYMVKHGMTD